MTWKVQQVYNHMSRLVLTMPVAVGQVRYGIKWCLSVSRRYYTGNSFPWLSGLRIINKPLTEPRPVYVGIVVKILTLGQDFLRILRYFPAIIMIQGTAVGIAPRLWSGRPVVQIPTGTWDFSFPPISRMALSFRPGALATGSWIREAIAPLLLHASCCGQGILNFLTCQNHSINALYSSNLIILTKYPRGV
jgi:hypothetical protein